MKSKIKIGLIFSAIILIFHIIPGEKKALYDIITGDKMENFKLVWPFSRYLLEPFVGFEEYLISTFSYFQLSSLIIWLFIFSLIIGFIKRAFKIGTILKYFSISVLVFLSLIVFVMITPLPSPYLETPENYLKANFHSHTYYSYDAIDSPEENVRFHKKMGYDFFFVTDQRTTEGFNNSAKLKKSKEAFPGIQIRAKEGNALLVLGNEYFDGKEFWNKTNKEIINLAHSKGLLVICPHWWKWRIPPIEELFKNGVDGFEIYNPGYKNITALERKSIIELCLKNNLLMVGSIDWHGWAWTSNVWTIIEKNKEEIVNDPIKYLKANKKTMILVYKRNETQKPLRILFEPFFVAYYYFGDIKLFQIFAWILWLILFAFASKYFKAISIVLSVICFSLSVYFGALSFLIKGNETFLPLVVPIFILLGFGWLAVWGMNSRKSKK